MSTTDFIVKSFDGLEINCRKWNPVGTPRARVLFIHGYCEFLDAYEDWFPMVAEAGLEVIMYEQRGHGKTARSPKEYGISDEDSIRRDSLTMIDYVTKDYNGKLIMWGFSMGGAICLNYMVLGEKKERFDSYISVAPYIETNHNTNRGSNAVKLAALPYIAKIWPSFVNTVALEPEKTTNNPAKWELYKTQPQRHMRTSAQFMNDAVNRGRRLSDPNFIANIVDRPLSLAHGTGDQVCEFSASQRFFNMVKLSDKEFDVYEGSPHELMQCIDSDRLEHWRRVKLWIDKHSSS